MKNPKFDFLLAQMSIMHDRKNADYATSGNHYSNFEEAAATAGCSVDTVFAVLIGVKLARLKELLSSGKTPQNESVADSRLDLAVYSALWASYHLQLPSSSQSPSTLGDSLPVPQQSALQQGLSDRVLTAYSK